MAQSVLCAGLLSLATSGSTKDQHACRSSKLSLACAKSAKAGFVMTYKQQQLATSTGHMVRLVFRPMVGLCWIVLPKRLPELCHLHAGQQLTCRMCVLVGKIYRWERRFRSCPATVTMCIILHAWHHGSKSTTHAPYVDLSCQRMTWRMKTRKSETRGRQKTGRVLPMLCLILTFCIHNAGYRTQ